MEEGHSCLFAWVLHDGTLKSRDTYAKVDIIGNIAKKKILDGNFARIFDRITFDCA
jgi:hypothetical protein